MLKPLITAIRAILVIGKQHYFLPHYKIAWSVHEFAVTQLQNLEADSYSSCLIRLCEFSESSCQTFDKLGFISAPFFIRPTGLASLANRFRALIR